MDICLKAHFVVQKADSPNRTVVTYGLSAVGSRCSPMIEALQTKECANASGASLGQTSINSLRQSELSKHI